MQSQHNFLLELNRRRGAVLRRGGSPVSRASRDQSGAGGVALPPARLVVADPPRSGLAREGRHRPVLFVDQAAMPLGSPAWISTLRGFAVSASGTRTVSTPSW